MTRRCSPTSNDTSGAGTKKDPVLVSIAVSAIGTDALAARVRGGLDPRTARPAGARALHDPVACGPSQSAQEDAVISQEPNGVPGSYSARIDDERLAFVRICAHYFSNGAFLEEGQLLRDAHKLAGIPGALIHGRLDLGSPVQTAWELAKVWPDARLTIIEDSGHTGSEAMSQAVIEATNAFASR